MANQGEIVQALRKLLDRGDLSGIRTALSQGVDLEDPEIKKLISELERRERLLNRGRTATAVSAIRCKNCGASPAPKQKNSEAFTCSSCGTLLTLDGDILFPRSNPRGIHGDFPKLGLRGKFEGKECEIIGRSRFSSNVREWDSEDSGYTDLYEWSYDEWVLLFEDGTLWFLIEDQDGFSTAEAFLPKQPVVPTLDLPMVNFHDGRNCRIQEFSQASLLFAEGELPWIPKPGVTVYGAEYSVSGISYSAQWQGASPRSGAEEAQEIEFFRSSPIEAKTLYEIFGATEELARLVAEEEERKSYIAMAKNFLIGAAVLATFGVWGMFSDRNPVFSHTSTVEFLTSAVEKKELGPVQLTHVGRPHEVELRASINDNSNLEASITLLDEEGAPVREAEGDFWRESGYDEGEYYSESDTSTSILFRLEEAGNYFIDVDIEPGNTKQGTVTVLVREKVSLSRYYFLGSFALLLGALSLWKKRSLNPAIILLLVATTLWFIFKAMAERAAEEE